MEESPLHHLAVRNDQDVLIATILTPHVRGDDLAAQLQSELFEAVNRSGARKVVIDFRHVTDLSSRGFGAFAAFYQDFVKGQGGEVALCGLSPFVQESLALIRFIDGQRSVPMVGRTEAASAPTAPRPRGKPLFEVVEADVPSAVARLRAAS